MNAGLKQLHGYSEACKRENVYECVTGILIFFAKGINHRDDSETIIIWINHKQTPVLLDKLSINKEIKRKNELM